MEPVLCKVKFVSAAKGKICGQNPQRGDKESVQIPAPIPVSHLSI